MQVNPNESEVIFQPEWIKINPNELESIRVSQFSNWFELNIRFKSIRVRIDSDSVGLKIYFGFIRIHSDRSLGLNRNESD